ncbi:hypothetical protein ASD40_18715 [Paenibacillus sp. Root444D2]|nr:hypothetical protein ASD40_18715 [Paenibacillus sp. Root444D2]
MARANRVATTRAKPEEYKERRSRRTENTFNAKPEVEIFHLNSRLNTFDISFPVPKYATKKLEIQMFLLQIE